VPGVAPAKNSGTLSRLPVNVAAVLNAVSGPNFAEPTAARVNEGWMK